MKRLAATVILAAALLPWGATAQALPKAGDRPTSLSASCAGAVSWKNARRFVGHNATVKGPIVGTYYASRSNGTPTFLNVGAGCPSTHRVTSVIWGERPRRGT